jgi:Leucine-rich repeat (LRR) protein
MNKSPHVKAVLAPATILVLVRCLTLAAVLVAVLMISGCQLLWGPEDSDGPVGTMPPAGNPALGIIRLRARDDSLGRAILPPGDQRAATTFDISATGPGGPVNLVDIPSSTVDLNDLQIGTWTITVIGKNKYGGAILEGSAEAVVTAGSVTPIVVPLYPINGQGTLAFTLNWPEAHVADPSVAAWIKPYGQPDSAYQALSLGSPAGASVSWGPEEYATGSYVVRIVLSSSGIEVATVILAAVAYPSLASDQVYNLPSWEISHGPPAPTSLVATAETDTAISLTWVDNAITEDGFTVERSPDGVDWSVIAAALPANHQSYLDEGLDPDTDYQYRVIAYNDFPGAGVSIPAMARTRLRLDTVLADAALLQVFIDDNKVYCDQPTTLTAPSKGISSLAGIERVSGLVYINLSDNLIADLSPLAGLPALVDLRADNNEITTFPPQTGFSFLTLLNLSSQRGGLVDPSGIWSISSIEQLDLGANGLVSVSGIGGLSNLRYLRLDHNPLADTSPLAGLNSMVHLSIAYAGIIDIDFTEAMSGLWQLDIGYNGIGSLLPLANKLLLEYLHAPYNAITDASPLATTTALTQLALNNNDLVTGVADLASLASATIINLLDNPRIPPADIQTLRLALEPGCDIYWNEPGSGEVTIIAPADPTVSLSGQRASMLASGDSMTVSATVTGAAAQYYYWYLDGQLVDHGADVAAYTVITDSESWGRRFRLDVLVLTSAGLRGAYAAYRISQ